MTDRKDPWTILGVARTATIEEIKTQYRKLAMTLHPDKHAAELTPEQRKEREDRFKEVTVAYQVATDIAKARDNGCEFNTCEDYEKWKTMWERVESMIRNQNLMTVLGNVVKGTIKDMAKVAIERMSQPQTSHSSHSPHSQHSSYSTYSHYSPYSNPANENDSENDSDISSDVDTSSYDSAKSDRSRQSDTETPPPCDPHIFHVSVTLDEVHSRSSRRVRLFLKDYPKDPFFVDIDFSRFPEMIYEHHFHKQKHTVVLKMMVKKHPVYYWDPSLGGWDLYTTMPITLSEYFTGCSKTLPKLGKTLESQIYVDIPAFANLKKPIVYDMIGLRNKGNVYIMLEVCLPTKDLWKSIEKQDPTIIHEFLNMCKKIENPNAPHCTSS
jgi:hypothetical protein